MDSNPVEQLWTAAQQAGPFGALLGLYLFWRADTERRKLQSDKDQLLRDTLSGLNAAASAVRELTGIVRPK